MSKDMNFLEKLAIGLISSAEQTAPIFVHSAQGTLILNASEIFLGGLLGALQSRTPASPVVTPGPVAVPPAA